MLITRSKEFRKKPTAAEDRLWQHLRAKRFHGIKFRRQHIFGNYIVDFYCKKLNLVIEVDGFYHLLNEEYDTNRTEYLNSLGLKVIRFWNDEIFNDLNFVLQRIHEQAY